MKHLEESKRYGIARAAREALDANGFEKRAGWCQRWVKQALRSADVPEELLMDGSPSARAAFERYEDAGYVMPVGTVANIGDILYKVRPKDGEAGHVGIYLGSNNVAENSSAHWTGRTQDARGRRDISNYPSYRVVRLWKK